MLSTSPDLQEILQLAPEWEPVLRNHAADGAAKTIDFCNRLGAKSLFAKALDLKEERGKFLVLLRDGYFQPHLSRMLQSNQNLRRFWGQSRLSSDEQKQQSVSFSTELAHKMEGVLIKQLNQAAEDGFKVLLPAYMQRAVQNAVVDYIRQESSWEKQTLQDMYLDPEQDDPRGNVADDTQYAPENIALSQEKVVQLNQLRSELEAMLADSTYPQDALSVVDCLFGLGLTPHSRSGVELTMRECCDLLHIAGDTQARRIARCQVLLDKALDLIRQRIREKLPTIVEAWQGELNVNNASRRELTQQLELTEGEVERLIKGRQYHSLPQLVDTGVVKPKRLKEIAEKGAVAAFIPVDLNAATVRDMVDILGLDKTYAQRFAAERPFASLDELTGRQLADKQLLNLLVKRGAVVRAKAADKKRIDLNRAEAGEIIAAGVPETVVNLLLRGRPFLTWSELEDYLGSESPAWSTMRQKFCLGTISS